MSNKRKKINIDAVDKFFSEPSEVIKGQTTLDVPGVQEEHDTQQKQEEPKPTSVRGQKLPRINIAFTHENLEYLRLVSKIKGISITQYVNDLIQADRESRGDKLEKIEDILEDMLKEV